MAKKEIFSRLNLKDYNKELEMILEEKDFSSQVKNLLLSMFYKLEIGYKDYVIVKRDSPSKEAFLESLMYIIKEKCDEIELIKPNIDKPDEKKFYISERKISCYQNEAVLLHAILELGEKNFIISEEEIIKAPIQIMLRNGYELDTKEALTNFDGWAWNSNLDKDDDTDYYLIYELLRIIMGNNFMYDWKRDRRNNTDYLGQVKNKSKEFYEAVCKYCVVRMSKNTEGKKFINHELKNIKTQFQRMEEKNEFLREKYEEKNFYSSKVKEIDELLNDNEKLRQEFSKRNTKLAETEKIFSISDLEEIIQDERTETVKKMENVNNILQPKNYLRKMQKLQEDIDLIESSNVKKVTDDILNDKLIKLQLVFIEYLKKKLSNIETKKDMFELIYSFRYYLFLPIYINGEAIEVKKIPEIKDEIEKLENKIITKACKLKTLTIVNQDINYNAKIIQKIINTKTIELSNICVMFSKMEKEIQIEIYDDEVLDRVENIKKDKEKDFRIKFGRKIKLFT